VEQLRGMAAPLCVVTGALIALTTVVGRFVTDPERLADTSDDPAVVVNGVVALAASVLLVLVLVALYAWQGDVGGSLQSVAFMVALAGTVLLAGDFWFEAFVVPYLADVSPEVLGGDPGGVLLGGAVVSFLSSQWAGCSLGLRVIGRGHCRGRRWSWSRWRRCLASHREPRKDHSWDRAGLAGAVPAPDCGRRSVRGCGVRQRLTARVSTAHACGFRRML